jgi:hypothetical protein
LIGPPFQKIRKDYGLQWTLSFLNREQQLIRARDSKALYTYYLYNKSPHMQYPFLTKHDLVQILDFVDTFPYDSAQYAHRKFSEEEKLKFIQEYEDKENQQTAQTSTELIIDSLPVEDTTNYEGYGSGYGTSPEYRSRDKKTKKAKTFKAKTHAKKKNGS